MPGQCIDQQFVLRLILFEDIFQITKFASDQLQSPNLDISSASDLIQSVVTALSEKRSEEYWSDIQNHASELCAKVCLASGSIPPQRRDARQQSQVFGFYQVVDRLVSE